MKSTYICATEVDKVFPLVPPTSILANLLNCKINYANNINVPFRMFEYDDTYKKYEENFRNNYPFITTYNIVNFYKIHLLYELSKEFDEILFLDFDVIPLTTDNFFDVWDLNKGICV